VALQEQIGAGTCIKLIRNFGRDGLLCLTVRHCIAFAFQAALNSHEDVRTV
jgi:hypothetical protein